jgi:hypothetical protein
MNNSYTVSRFPIALEVPNRGAAQCEVIRHLAPLTIGTILKSLPLQDRVHKFEDKIVYIETGLAIGAEKQKTQFRRGDMAYMTSNGSICIFIKDSSYRPMNPIGIVKSNLEVVEFVRTGDTIILKNQAYSY